MVIKDDSNELMFSVEVTTYNQKEYIAQTLQSIIDQKHSYKYEILVSDDCSTDGTQDIIREFEKKYPDVVKPVYNEKNLGAMANYYATVARAKGKYLMGCAGDDYWLPGKVEKQINFMERNLDFDVCYGKTDILFASSGIIKSNAGENYTDFRELLTNGNNIPALTLCIRKTFFDKYLTTIKPQLKNWLMEDYPFLIFASFESNLFFIDQIFAVYRFLDNSVSHQTNTEKQKKFEDSTKDIILFYSKKYNYPTKNIEDSEKTSFTKSCVNVFKLALKSIIPNGFIILYHFIRKRYNK